jgi:hypothetical protein
MSIISTTCTLHMQWCAGSPHVSREIHLESTSQIQDGRDKGSELSTSTSFQVE